MYVRHLYNKIGVISQEVLKKFRNKSITRNIFRTMNLLCEDFIVSLS